MKNDFYVVCEDCGCLVRADKVRLYHTVNGDKFICNDCIKDYTICEDCGRYVQECMSVHIGGGCRNEYDVCNRCFERGDYIACEECGDIFAADDMTYTDDGAYLCEDCLDQAYHCADCDAYFYYEGRGDYDVHGEWICEDCIERDYVYCDDCGDLIYSDDAYYTDDGTFCGNCIEEHNNRVIKDYHESHRRDRICYGSTGDESDGKYIGFELEVDEGNNPEECAEELSAAFGDRLNYERDGSLTSGFEIISEPHAIELIGDKNCGLDIERLLDICRGHGFKSHDARTCGLHFHLSRTIFGRNDKKRASSIAKLVYFYDEFYDDIVKVSRRDVSGLSWCKKYDIGREDNKTTTKAKAALDIVRERYNDRYHAVNLCNYATIEIRAFRGTLIYSSFMAAVDFAYTTAKNAARIGWRDVNNVDKWLEGLKPDTLKYINERGAFQNAEVIKGVAICA